MIKRVKQRSVSVWWGLDGSELKSTFEAAFVIYEAFCNSVMISSFFYVFSLIVNPDYYVETM